MIKRFFKRSRSLESLFKNYKGYVIESEFAGLFYVADDKDFAIVRSDGYVRCPLEEVPELIGMLKVEDYRRRILDMVIEQCKADGCKGCAFINKEKWEKPCKWCARNCKDYWRAGEQE